MQKIRNNGTFILAGCLLAILAIGIANYQPAQSATPVTGGLSAKASGAVTAGLIVKLTAADTVATATAVTDALVGVCEVSASSGAITRYAPPGTITNVTSGAAFDVGDLLIPNASGKAIELPTTTSTTQRFIGFALEAAGGADESVRIYVTLGQVEQFDSTGNIAFTGDLTVAAGKDISFAAGAGYLELLGTTNGGIRVDPIDAGTNTTTITNSAAGAAVTVTLPAVTGTLGWTPTGGTTKSGAGAVPITHAYVALTTTGADALSLANGKPGQVLTIKLVVDGGAGTLTVTTSTSIATIVFEDIGDVASLMYIDDTVGWVILGLSGLAGAPTYTSPA